MHKPALNYDWWFDNGVLNNDFSTVAVIQNVAKSASNWQIGNDRKKISETNQKAIKLRMTEETHEKLSQDSTHTQFSFRELWQWNVALKLITDYSGPRKSASFFIPLLIDIWLRYRLQVHKREKKRNAVRHLLHKTKSLIFTISAYIT